MINLRLTGLMMGLLFLLIIMPLASADMITPGFKPVSIENKIINIGDFPDHVFVSAKDYSKGEGGPLCLAYKIDSDGIIEQYYKFCSVAVYAIKKSDFNENILSRPDVHDLAYEKYMGEYFNSSKAIKVLSNIEIYKTVPVLSTQESITNEYTIDLTKNQEGVVVNRVIERNSMFYVYIGASVLALLVVVLIISMRKK